MTSVPDSPGSHRTARAALVALVLIVAPDLVLPAFAQPAPGSAARQVPAPVVSGPIGGDAFDSPTNFYTFFATDIALASHGYVEEEYFLNGTARIYDAPGTTPAAPPTELARVVREDVPYRTRMVVRRPIDPARFNGTVLLEWLNTSDGFDGEYFWVQTHRHVVRDGYVYVGLSTQDQSMSHEQFGLKMFSPLRYGNLDVTNGGDACCRDAETAYDIVAQTGRAVRDNAAVHHLKAHIERDTPLPAGVDPAWAPEPTWVQRDERGNALGGIQLAAMAAPTARADGLECGNIGLWEPFTADRLKSALPAARRLRLARPQRRRGQCRCRVHPAG